VGGLVDGWVEWRFAGTVVGLVGWLVGRFDRLAGLFVDKDHPAMAVFTTREQRPLRRPIPTLRWVGWVGWLVASGLVGWLVGWLDGWVMQWLVGRQVVRLVGWRVGLYIGWRVCSLLSALGPCPLSSLCQKKSPSSDGSLHNAGTPPPEKAHPHAQVGWLGWLVGCQWVGWLVGWTVG
jgi:hypothetical protein